MKAVRESKRLVALLAVLFLMSGVLSVIAAASPEDTETKNTNSIENIPISASVGIQSPKGKQILYEKNRSERISVQVWPAEEVSVPAAEPAEDIFTEPVESIAEPSYEDVSEESAAEYSMIPAEETAITDPEEPAADYSDPSEYVEEPEYTETIYEEPAEAEIGYEPVSEIPEVPQEYIPEEPAQVYESAEVYEPAETAEPAAAPEPETQQPEAAPEVVLEPAAVTEPEPSPEPEPVEESKTPEEPKLTYLGNFMLTAYCPCASCCGAYASGTTASGTVPTEGVTIAMDGLEFGTKVSINGHIYTVEDRGTAYGHVDVFFADHGSALAFGLQYADVYLVE